ncbi:MAG: carboxypeptidase-like regulatory domain-containing protein [Gemmatimonadetes bacterium]|nr:carboxypeptidase-like regulatory domain-containing protein [Gemmatimonadota bacterium]
MKSTQEEIVKGRLVPRARRRSVRLGWVAALIVAAVACGDDDAGVDPIATGGAISGTVARQKTADGVPNAVLALRDVEDRVVATAVTGNAGRFTFSGLEQGAYRVRFVAPELAGLDPLFDALEPVEWDVALSSDPVELVFAVVGLVPARITGTVTCGGAPAADVAVRVIGGETDATATTDEAGIFTALDLLPGTYAVIPLEAPCALTPQFRAATVRPGQFVDLNFGG